MNYKPISVEALKRYSLENRPGKVSVAEFGLPHAAGLSFADFVRNLPGFLAVNDFRDVARSIVKARSNGRPVILGMGAHPIKVGLSPIIIDLMKRGIITALACNGACIIHDFELSYAGQTSEDVARELNAGTFGMALETGQNVNRAISNGVATGLGIGRSVGAYIAASGFSCRDKSIFGAAAALDIPATVHVAIGADIIHMHPEADGAAIGEGSMRDFRLLTSVVADLEGGVYINLGSAVILPEVFLKALTVARNLGNRVDAFTTVNMDFIQHYRPRENVLRRPTAIKGRNFALTGHHEIMFPLLAATVLEEIAQ
ncbi:MAG TPA: hypothetical protein VLH56_12230 [Dissulfurispiraceae bacterium]|nr:hypothetical protein [Dissulfurispiraceae bacterium]